MYDKRKYLKKFEDTCNEILEEIVEISKETGLTEFEFGEDEYFTIAFDDYTPFKTDEEYDYRYAYWNKKVKSISIDTDEMEIVIKAVDGTTGVIMENCVDGIDCTNVGLIYGAIIEKLS